MIPVKEGTEKDESPLASGLQDVRIEVAHIQAASGETSDAMSEAKYPRSSAVAVMQRDGPKAATVRISPLRE